MTVLVLGMTVLVPGMTVLVPGMTVLVLGMTVLVPGITRGDYRGLLVSRFNLYWGAQPPTAFACYAAPSKTQGLGPFHLAKQLFQAQGLLSLLRT